MTQANAAGARVSIRDIWKAFLFMFLSGGFYRLYWYFALNRDLGRFGRAREPGHRPWISVRPVASVFAIVAGFAAVGMLQWDLPWSPLAYAVGHDHHDHSALLASRIIYGVVGGLLLIIPATSMIRTMQRVRVARTLGGLRERRLTQWRWFLPILLMDLIGIPAGMFALQACANELWRQYPPLYDEDIFGELAPAADRPGLAAQRPALHEAREQAAVDTLENPRITPWVVLGVSAICTVLFVIEVVCFGWNPDDRQILRMGALDAHVHGLWWHFIAANFLHANVGHITGNLVIWVLLGTRVERAYGSRRMALLVVFGVVGSSIGSLLAFPNEPGLGVSGVIFAMVTAGAARDLLARRPIGRFSWALVVAGGLGSFAGGINWGAHAGGGAAGFVFAAVVWVVWRVPATHAIAEPFPSAVIHPDAPLAPVHPADRLARMAALQTEVRTGAITPAAYATARAALLL